MLSTILIATEVSAARAPVVVIDDENEKRIQRREKDPRALAVVCISCSRRDKETISVHLGPVWYIERQDTKIAAGDKIEVKGSRITYEGKPAIIARRDPQGRGGPDAA